MTAGRLAIFDNFPQLHYNAYKRIHMKEFYTVSEFADMLGITSQTVYQWIYDGLIHSVQIKRKSAHRIPASELERIKSQRGN